jgi:hypothetical protein
MKELKLLVFILLAFSCQAVLFIFAEDVSTAELNKDTILSVGDKQIAIKTGTAVQVLSLKGSDAVISLVLPDGSPLITQIPLAVLTLNAPKQVASPPPPVISSQIPVTTSVSSTVAAEPPAHASSLRSLEQSLKLAGDNSPELESFLKSQKSPDAELLVRTARQYDLVNLTAKLLSDDLESVEKAKANAQWSSRVPEDIWREFVLPYRVADEPLDDFKPDFFSRLAPIVSTATESGEAAQLVHKWYWTGNGGKPWVDFKVSESRDQSPSMLLNESKSGRCFEMNMLCVALLRSAGIPARLAGTSFWMNDEYYHYWVEYYDTKTETWLYYEGAVADPEFFMGLSSVLKHAKKRFYPTVYALPGFCSIADPIGKERWDLLINSTSLYLPTGTIHFGVPAAGSQEPPVYSVYCWNLSAWRCVAQARGDQQGEAEITLSANDLNYPYLVSTAWNGQIYWGTAKVPPNATVDMTSLAGGQTVSDIIMPVTFKTEEKTKAQTSEQ